MVGGIWLGVENVVMWSERLLVETLLVLYSEETLPNTKKLCATLFGSH